MRRISSLVTEDGTVRVSLETVPMPQPRDGQVLIRVEASPLNPSDIAVLLSGAKVAEGRREGEELVVPLPEGARGLLTARVGQPTVVGNEGSGVVVGDRCRGRGAGGQDRRVPGRRRLRGVPRGP